jgi:hypothetical protein
LFSARRERPRGRAAKQGDELAPSHARLSASAYHIALGNAASCITAKSGDQSLRWVIKRMTRFGAKEKETTDIENAAT